jgi:signal transduction histidine kinase
VAGWTLTGVASALVASSLVLVAGVERPEGGVSSSIDSYVTVPFVAGFAVVVLAFSLVGALIVARRPRNGLGWLFAVDGVLTALLSFLTVYQFRALETDPGSLPGGELAAWTTDIMYLPIFGTLTVFLFLLFPDGRLDTRGRRLTAAGAVAGASLGGAASVVEPHLYSYPEIENPAGLGGSEALFVVLAGLGAVLLTGSLIASIALLVGRLRRARGRERDQLRLLAWTAVVSTTLILPGFVTQPGALLLVLSGIGALLLPASVGVAILRHRLLDIDLVIRRTFVVALLGAFITAVYLGVVVGAGALAGDRASPVPSAVAAALVAIAFQPVRRRAQRLANRLVYGDRATPYEVLSDLANRMADTYAADDLLLRIARTIGEGIGAERSAVWLRIGDRLRASAVWPDGGSPARSVRLDGDELPELPAGHAVPVRYGGELLGALTLDTRSGEPLAPTEAHLLADVASQSGLALHNVRLTEELRTTIEELQTSRQRLVTAQDEERRRLERDIHDGAQQQLVALAVKIRMADAMVDRDRGRAHEVLTEAQEGAQQALDELRDLARGIFPPLLADRGLAPALEAQARKAAVPVSLRADGIGRFPQQVEATAYFCCLEAVQNAAKYSHASVVEIELQAADGTLRFEVRDGGRGFDPTATPRGTGLQNMADRLEAVGGSIEIRSRPGSGTTVIGRIPLSPATGARRDRG